MLSIAYVPWIEFFALGFINIVKKWHDSGSFFYNHSLKTKCVTSKQYIDLYAGPKYQITFRISSVMTLVFLSFMYGMAIPTMIPLAFFGICSIYVNERLLLAYYYQKP
jgi:hypothetical protein